MRPVRVGYIILTNASTHTHTHTHTYACMRTHRHTHTHTHTHTVSMQLLTEDVQLLKKGLQDVKEEKDKEPNNFIIFISYSQLRMHSKQRTLSVH